MSEQPISPQEDLSLASVNNDTKQKGLTATASVLAAILASSCCIGPLVLLSLGISGAWIGNLTALEPYKPIFILITLAFLGTGFWQVYVKPKKKCEDGSYCANPHSDRVIKIVLWFATALVLTALTIDFWAPLFY